MRGFEWLGFPVATAILTMVIGTLFNASLPAAGISGVVMGIFLWYAFDSLLDVTLPLGAGLINGARYGYRIYLSQGFAVAMTPKTGDRPDRLLRRDDRRSVAGLGPINGVAILLPLAFALHLPAESALILLATVYIGCEYGGRISSILLNVPGDAAAIMTALDGYRWHGRRGGVALSISAVSSFFGSLIAIGGIILLRLRWPSGRWRLVRQSIFALMVFAIACLGSMMAQNPLKSFLSALIGLGLATVGVDANTGVYRFTFDGVHLSDGVQFIVVVIGLFSVSEILLMLEHTSSGRRWCVKPAGCSLTPKSAVYRYHAAFSGYWLLCWHSAAGATIASAITYMTEKNSAATATALVKAIFAASPHPRRLTMPRPVAHLFPC